MFDKTLVVQRPHVAGPTHVTIEERRAPTDESVKLLREMEAEAEKHILRKLVTDAGPNRIGAVVLEQALCHEGFKRLVYVAFDLNGETIKARVDLDDSRWHDPVGLARTVAEELAKAIATEIVARQMVRFRP